MRNLIIILLLSAFSIPTYAGFLEINSTFPLGKTNLNDASLLFSGGLAQSVRSEGAMVTNPATLANDRFISFKFGFAGSYETVKIDGVSIVQPSFANNQIGLILPTKIAGVFAMHFYNSFENDFLIHDDLLGQEYQLSGAISTAKVSWGRDFFGIKFGIAMSKNFGSYFSRSTLDPNGAEEWEAIYEDKVSVYYEDKMFDDATFGFQKKLNNITFGGSYSLGDKLKLSKISTQSSQSPYINDLSYRSLLTTKKDSIFNEIELGQRVSGGVLYKMNKSGINLDFSVQPDAVGEYLELGAGYSNYLVMENNLPLKVGVNYKKMNKFNSGEYSEGIGAIGTEYLLDKQRGKFDLSFGGIYRKSNNITENALFISVGITGFSTWGEEILK